jgi:hypothetical protein
LLALAWLRTINSTKPVQARNSRGLPAVRPRQSCAIGKEITDRAKLAAHGAGRRSTIAVSGYEWLKL